MLKEVKYLFSNSSKYEMPVFDQEMPRAVFMDYVRKGVEKLYARTESTLRNYRMYANILEQYLIKYGIEKVQPTEPFIKEMWDRLKEDGHFPGRDYEWATRKKAPRFTRKIINEYFHPTGLAQRDLIKEIAIQRYERIFKLTKNSQEAIKWFELNGRRVEAMSVLVQKDEEVIDPNNQIIKTIHQITNKPLLPITKCGKIDHAMRFLEYVNRNGFEEATKEDVEKFKEICIQRGVKQIEDYMAHVATFYINIYSKGFVKSNPFSHVSLKMNGGAVRKEFFTLESAAKLRDLSTLDRNNKDDVRDRLFGLLGYDLAIRLGEILALKISDFQKDETGEWSVVLRSEVQKGSNKDAEVMYFFFDETKELLEFYIKKVRDLYKPTSDHLILSNQWGGEISSQAASKRFGEMCKKLGLITYYGNKPSPHLLRHSFATLNIEPIGLDIPLYEMSQRLRHTRVETTRKHYIHNNPYLKKIKHEVLRKKTKKKTPTNLMDEMSLADLEHWFSDKLGYDSAMIHDMRVRHKKAFPDMPKSQVDKNVTDNRMFISEKEALERIKDLKMSASVLKGLAIKKAALAEDSNGLSFKFREDFVNDLAHNWVLAESYRERFQLNRMKFHRLLKKEGWHKIKIGKALYISRLDCV